MKSITQEAVIHLVLYFLLLLAVVASAVWA